MRPEREFNTAERCTFSQAVCPDEHFVCVDECIEAYVGHLDPADNTRLLKLPVQESREHSPFRLNVQDSVAGVAVEGTGQIDCSFDYCVKLTADLHFALHDQLAGRLDLVVTPAVTPPLLVFDVLLRNDAIGAHIYRVDIDRVNGKSRFTVGVENGNRAVTACGKQGLHGSDCELGLRIFTEWLAKNVVQVRGDGYVIGGSCVCIANDPDGITKEFIGDVVELGLNRDQ